MGNITSRLFNRNLKTGVNYTYLPRSRCINDRAEFSSEVLTVKNIDYCIAANGAAHHTSKYELMTRTKDPCLVVRRGQKFTIDITFSRPYDPIKDEVSFTFKVADAEKPSYGQGTLVALPLMKDESEVKSHWSAIIQSQTGNHLVVELLTSSYSVVAQWKMDIDTKCQDYGVVSYSHPLGFYLLFNPWCPQDDVYVAKQDHREEYVLLDAGLIWKNKKNNRHVNTHWKYGQYEKDILDFSLQLIQNIGKIKGNALRDPMKVSRAISTAVNYNENNGVLEGSWEKKISDGTAPSSWMGSIEILQAYFKKRQPVKYGQCWVFAGVVATVCRAVGLPCRPVTTYESAHDTQGSLTIDYFLDKNNDIIKDLSGDSVWNFHVWNEIWMKRRDLDENGRYDGWQVVDSTPQEESENLHRCGPASVAAIKLGEINKPYDNAFVFAEVNADVVHWRYNESTNKHKIIKRNKVVVGQDISTKAVGKWEREDITSNYKYPEKSSKERDIMLKALRMSENPITHYYLNEKFNEVKFELAEMDDINIGNSFDVVFKMKSHSSDKEYTVTGSLKVQTILYTGKIMETVKVLQLNTTVKASSTEIIKMNVSFDEYNGKLPSQGSFKISCYAIVHGTDYEYLDETKFNLRKPTIEISQNGLPTASQEFESAIKLLNPLPIPLTKCTFSVQGPSLNTEIKLSKKVAPGDFATAVVKATPPWSGNFTISAKFSSKELDDVDGFLNFVVK